MDNPNSIGGSTGGSWTGWLMGGASSLLETAKSALGYDDTRPVPTSPTVGLNTGVSHQTGLQTRGATPAQDAKARILEEAAKAADEVLEKLINPALDAIKTRGPVFDHDVANLVHRCETDPILLLMLETGQTLLNKGEYQAAQHLEYLYRDEGRMLKKCFKAPFENIQDFGMEALTREGKTLFRSPTAIPGHITTRTTGVESLDDLETALQTLSKEVTQLKTRQQASTVPSNGKQGMTEDYVVCDEFAAATREFVGFMLKAVDMLRSQGELGKWLPYCYERSQFLNECLDQGCGEKIRTYLPAKDKLNAFLTQVEVKNYSVEEPVPPAPAAPVANIESLKEAQEQNLDPIHSLRLLVDKAISEHLQILRREPGYKGLSEKALKEQCSKDIGSFRSMLRLPQLLLEPLTIQSIQQINTELATCGQIIERRVKAGASSFDRCITALTAPIKQAANVAEAQADNHRKKVFARYLWARAQIEPEPKAALKAAQCEAAMRFQPVPDHLVPDALPNFIKAGDLRWCVMQEDDSPATLAQLYESCFKSISNRYLRQVEEWANSYPAASR